MCAGKEWWLEALDIEHENYLNSPSGDTSSMLNSSLNSREGTGIYSYMSNSTNIPKLPQIWLSGVYRPIIKASRNWRYQLYEGHARS